mmetsp:Transcript_105448/g.251150  ORF Transcript_105448/g.251150 Transcript_105448/m.251150 type:complete len:225 (+) Transcript_105448:438-1112(+)
MAQMIIGVFLTAVWHTCEGSGRGYHSLTLHWQGSSRVRGACPTVSSREGLLDPTCQLFRPSRGGSESLKRRGGRPPETTKEGGGWKLWRRPIVAGRSGAGRCMPKLDGSSCCDKRRWKLNRSTKTWRIWRRTARRVTNTRMGSGRSDSCRPATRAPQAQTRRAPSPRRMSARRVTRSQSGCPYGIQTIYRWLAALSELPPASCPSATWCHLRRQQGVRGTTRCR